MTQLPSPRGDTRATPAGSGEAVTLGVGARVRFTAKRDGDMGDPTGADPAVRARRHIVVPRPWTWLTQVHGAAVAVADAPGASAGHTADAVVSAAAGVALAILTADCAPVAFASPEGVIGVAHAGWRGLMAGVIDETVSAMRALGAGSIVAALGPCIHAECYAFGPDDLDAAAAMFGPSVRAETSDGQQAFDIPGAVRVALRRAGVDLVADAGICTSCSAEHWSWRARQDRERQATVVWCP